MGGGCSCVSGFVRVNNVCYPTCGNNTYLNGNVCSCLPGFVRNTRGACVPSTPIVCPPDRVLGTNGVCVCQNGFIATPTGTCVQNCSTNEILQGTQCVCANGFVRNSFGQCINPCPQSQVFVNNQCVCNTGFVRVGSNCVPIPNCRTN